MIKSSPFRLCFRLLLVVLAAAVVRAADNAPLVDEAGWLNGPQLTGDWGGLRAKAEIEPRQRLGERVHARRGVGIRRHREDRRAVGRGGVEKPKRRADHGKIAVGVHLAELEAKFPVGNDLLPRQLAPLRERRGVNVGERHQRAERRAGVATAQ